ncbi:cryptococcal mannosyltransferase 1-domain-containing protein [Amylostereum chailletii]|nr:cryptococcal mannosyltransferase 1-domain-containing protein [Amylostereum chailletii]
MRSEWPRRTPFRKSSFRLLSRSQLLLGTFICILFTLGYYSFSYAYLLATAGNSAFFLPHHVTTIQTDAYTLAPNHRPVCLWQSWQHTRYARLSENHSIYLAANFYNNEDVLPTFFQELPILLHHLGPKHVYVSIYENGSTDKTGSLLILLDDLLTRMGTPHTIVTSEDGEISRDHPDHRIAILAGVRNKALEPLMSGEAARAMHGKTFDQVLFMNDIFHCATDILEVLYQKDLQGANQACATDWGDPVVYDRWVMRAISGRPFYDYEDLIEFFNGDRKPKVTPTVFSCWNGATVFDASAFAPPDPIRFRVSKNDLDQHGTPKNVTNKASECFLPSVDMWKKAMGKILLVTKASVAYEYDRYNKYRKDTLPPNAESEHVNWLLTPPLRVAMQDNAAWYLPERWAPWDEQ